MPKEWRRAWASCYCTICRAQYFVYPKVKVRREGPDDQPAVQGYDWSCLLSLKDIEFLSIQDTRFPVKEQRKTSPPSTAASTPKSYVPHVTFPAFPASEVLESVDKKSNSDEEERPNIRAGPILRPRAVVSSPDNDAVIGHKNRIKEVRPSPLRNHDLIQSRHEQCKLKPSRPIDGSPVATKKSKEADNKIGQRGKTGSATIKSIQRKKITADKLSSGGI